MNQILRRQTSRSHYGSKVPAVTVTVFKYRNKIGKICVCILCFYVYSVKSSWELVFIVIQKPNSNKVFLSYLILSSYVERSPINPNCLSLNRLNLSICSIILFRMSFSNNLHNTGMLLRMYLVPLHSNRQHSKSSLYYLYLKQSPIYSWHYVHAIVV